MILIISKIVSVVELFNTGCIFYLSKEQCNVVMLNIHVLAESDEEHTGGIKELMGLQGFDGEVEKLVFTLRGGLFLQLYDEYGRLALCRLDEVLIQGGALLSVGQEVFGEVGILVGADGLALDGRVVVHHHHIIGSDVDVAFTAPQAEVLGGFQGGDGILAEARLLAVPETAVGYDGDLALLVDNGETLGRIRELFG